jgi:hypothetical protein
MKTNSKSLECKIKVAKPLQLCIKIIWNLKTRSIPNMNPFTGKFVHHIGISFGNIKFMGVCW